MNYKTLKQLCDEHDISRATIQYWIKTGKLVTHRIGKRHRVYDSDWAAFLAECNKK